MRLRQGEFGDETVYSDDPVAVAKSFVEEGAEWLHIVDLDGARVGEPLQFAIAAEIARETGAFVELGGGIRTVEDAQRVLGSGISRVIMGSALLEREEVVAPIVEALGDRLVAGLDSRNNKLAGAGWLENSEKDVVATACWLAGLGCKRIIQTDISRDGMLTGPNIELLVQVKSASGLPVIASGGVSSLSDVAELAACAMEGVIIGKAIYEGKFSVKNAIKIAQSFGPIS